MQQGRVCALSVIFSADFCFAACFVFYLLFFVRHLFCFILLCVIYTTSPRPPISFLKALLNTLRRSSTNPNKPSSQLNPPNFRGGSWPWVWTALLGGQVYFQPLSNDMLELSSSTPRPIITFVVFVAPYGIKKTALGVPRRSPIQVLTKLNDA